MQNNEELNKAAWNSEVIKHNYWTKAVSQEQIEKAKNKDLTLPFLITKPMKQEWINELGNKLLLAAAGGGQQAPLLSAYGKDVTLIDISDLQLKQDKYVKQRDKLSFKIIQGSISESLPFEANSFDGVINPVSINFIKSPLPFYKEVHRVLKLGGAFITAFANPALYMFDVNKLEKGKMKIKYTLPFDADISLSEKQREKLIKTSGTFEYSHTLNTLIGSLIDLGFAITGFDTSPSDFEPIDSYLNECYLAIRAIKQS
ncbi:class I SAM-dependent methyltransferase [Bullifex porci]|uniref:class I SAM-dependent methyltransferase n=1 Tax=Bullifex porci TaxID=2606638 RepID=UPI0023EFCC71|nr:class I SAM-dependent methyltransferase [Bullifex porci]MDD7255057.1 class I SAM-dependent methyltransferase [Bullifex porci]MDY2741530.1 class I SAM-dependent methyltransferase [Bullifex porci]